MTELRYATDSGMALLTAVFTPFDEAGELELDTVAKQADDLLAWGSPAAYVGGTAGEGASLTTAERMALVERWCEVADGRLDVIVHVGHASIAEARRLAGHAEQVGAKAISAMPPYLHRPGSVAALVDACADIAGAAPTLPFTYYHIPGVTGVNLRASDVLLAARERIPTFAGVKFAANDMVDLQRCLSLAERGRPGGLRRRGEAGARGLAVGRPGGDRLGVQLRRPVLPAAAGARGPRRPGAGARAPIACAAGDRHRRGAGR